MRSLALLALAAASLHTACDTWPLHAHLPEPWEPTIVVPYAEDVLEDATLDDGELQDLGAFTAPSTLTITGAVDSCGWDPTAPWPVWPDHPVDTDADGETSVEQPWASGWYAGDVDLFALGIESAAWASAELTWDNPPPDGVNAPYEPPGDGPWQTESDLDFVLFDRDGNTLGEIVGEHGFTRDHPESTGGPLVLSPGDQVVFAVGCHHGVVAGYTLTVTLDAL